MADHHFFLLFSLFGGSFKALSPSFPNMHDGKIHLFFSFLRNLRERWASVGRSVMVSSSCASEKGKGVTEKSESAPIYTLPFPYLAIGGGGGGNVFSFSLSLASPPTVSSSSSSFSSSSSSPSDIPDSRLTQTMRRRKKKRIHHVSSWNTRVGGFDKVKKCPSCQKAMFQS